MGAADSFDFVSVGGGAAGYFGAIAYGEARPGSRIAILEKSGAVLEKVRISGGGRCNLTHASYEPASLCTRYPRGERQLTGPFHRWGAADTEAWFEERGVALKTEEDGRVFPRSDQSATVVECLRAAAAACGVEVLTRREIRSLEPGRHGRWLLRGPSAEEPPLEAAAVLLATGGIRNRAGSRIAAALGHEIVPPVPSLFTFKIPDPRLAGLAGLAAPSATVSVPGTRLRSTGPCLVTHWGLSGPAVLKLSAWGARELAAKGHRFEILVDWCSGCDAAAALLEAREASPKRRVLSGAPSLPVPARLFRRLAESAGIGEDTTWSNLTREARLRLAGELSAGRYRVEGKSMNKDEFVTAGGIALAEVDFRTMESRIAPGLYLAGEVLDIDGITGGFNFQAAWSTARIAGESAAARAAEGPPGR